MKATGIVRRIDDLGRVVIPKEIRRSMKLRDGDPLEIFTNYDGSVTFKKYMPYGMEDWAKVKRIISVILKEPFAIYDSSGDCQGKTNNSFPDEINGSETNCFRIDDGDYDNCLCYLMTADDNHSNAIAVIKALLKED